MTTWSSAWLGDEGDLVTGEPNVEHGTGWHGTAQVVTADPAWPSCRQLRRGGPERGPAGARRCAARHRRGRTGVGTIHVNNQEHVEAYYAVPCMVAVLHPLNIRLPGDQVTFIANHAEDQVVIVDARCYRCSRRPSRG